MAVPAFGASETVKPSQPRFKKLFPADLKKSVTFKDSIIANPLLATSQGRPLVIVAVTDGIIAALDAKTGASVWQLTVPTPEHQQAQIISTPALIEDKLVVLYQCIANGKRVSHRMIVINLTLQAIDENFPLLELTAEKPAADGVHTIKFDPPMAFSHSAVQYADRPGSRWGVLYAGFGNAGDSQPFHGWLFEIDMNAWLREGTQHAIRNVLLTTPEYHCPVIMPYGTQEMICGGGIWAPDGPLIDKTGDSYELLVPTGNGQIDLQRRDFANTLMRVSPDLQFDPGCDEQLCATFNPAQPDEACMSSCKNLFIPRPKSGDRPFRPANGECDKKTFWECVAWMDYDLGGNSPVKVKTRKGKDLILQASKDGGIYLLDARQLGRQYDRLQIAEICGTPSDVCKAGWMGMIVTKPVVTYVKNEPIIALPVFVPDQSHPGGVVGLKIVERNGSFKLQRSWQYPKMSSKQALQSFRNHPSLPVLMKLPNTGEDIVLVVDIARNGTLYALRMKDGSLVAKRSLIGAGRQLSAPLVYGNTVYLPSILPGAHKIFIEAYRLQ